MSAKTEQNLVLFPALKRFPHATVTSQLLDFSR